MGDINTFLLSYIREISYALTAVISVLLGRHVIRLVIGDRRERNRFLSFIICCVLILPLIAILIGNLIENHLQNNENIFGFLLIVGIILYFWFEYEF